MMAIVNKRLNRLPTWQFALIWAGSLALGFVVAGCINQLVAGRLNLSFLVSYGVVFTIASTTAATWSRQRRRQRAGDKRLRR
jgi:hypothetical protein